MFKGTSNKVNPALKRFNKFKKDVLKLNEIYREKEREAVKKLLSLAGIENVESDESIREAMKEQNIELLEFRRPDENTLVAYGIVKDKLPILKLVIVYNQETEKIDFNFFSLETLESIE